MQAPQSDKAPSNTDSAKQRKRKHPQGRQLFCPAHPEQKLEGNGRKYFLHLLKPEQLEQRGVKGNKAKLIINAYPVLVLSNEWLEQLFCPDCGNSWCHVIRHNIVDHTVRFAPRDLWQQVAHVDGLNGNPTVSAFTAREARRHRQRTAKGKRIFDPS
jgi:hypothetical protein